MTVAGIDFAPISHPEEFTKPAGVCAHADRPLYGFDKIASGAGTNAIRVCVRRVLEDSKDFTGIGGKGRSLIEEGQWIAPARPETPNSDRPWCKKVELGIGDRRIG